MVKNKNKNFVVDKLSKSIGKPKELWRSLKSLGLPSKQNSSSSICLEKNENLSFDPKTNAEIFNDFYSNLASNLVQELPYPPNKVNLNRAGKTFSLKPPTITVIQSF